MEEGTQFVSDSRVPTSVQPATANTTTTQQLANPDEEGVNAEIQIVGKNTSNSQESLSPSMGMVANSGNKEKDADGFTTVSQRRGQGRTI